MPKGCQNIIQSSSSPPTPGSEWSASCLLSWGCTFCSKLQFLLLNGAALVISFVLAENPVVIVIKELDLVKPATKDKVFNNSYKRTSWCELRFFFFCCRSMLWTGFSQRRWFRFHIAWAESELVPIWKGQFFLSAGCVVKDTKFLWNRPCFHYQLKVILQGPTSFIPNLWESSG